MTKTILLIDDDHDEIDIFIDALRAEKLDFRYLTASGALAGLKLLGEQTPDYIFLDYNMPKMNGIECLVKIKELLHLAHIPVIMYSSYMDEDTAETAMAVGAAGYIKKPFDMRKLASLLQPYL